MLKEEVRGEIPEACDVKALEDCLKRESEGLRCVKKYEDFVAEELFGFRVHDWD